jgi:hypothetical protein
MQKKDSGHVFYSKESKNWKQTIFILGSPRSGKSSLLNVLGSCKHTHFAEEPFDLTVIAQKSSRLAKDSFAYLENADFFQASLKNYYSELSLGRGYNFRKIDRSYVGNFKSRRELKTLFSIPRRLDVFQSEKYAEGTLILTLNDVEHSIEFLSNIAPRPRIIWLERPLHILAREIALKRWLSNESLSQQSDLLPGYNLVIANKFGNIYLPYFVPPEFAVKFLELNEFQRAYFYVLSQQKVVAEFRSRMIYDLETVNFGELQLDRRYNLQNFLRKYDLAMTNRTARIVEKFSNLNSEANLEISFDELKKVDLLFNKF